MHIFTFDGVTSQSIGLAISGKKTYGASVRDIEAVEIPGRNGDLIIDHGRYSNSQITYSCLLRDMTKLAEVRDFLMSHSGAYYTLADDYRPDEYRLAYVSADLNPEVTRENFAIFDVIFTCKPQRFLTSGQTVTTISAGGSATLTNPTHETALPLITCEASGSIVIGDTTITPEAAMTIDCDTLTAYSGTTSMAGKLQLISGVFPTLPPGTVSVSNSTTGTISITPRWWRV